MPTRRNASRMTELHVAPTLSSWPSARQSIEASQVDAGVEPRTVTLVARTRWSMSLEGRWKPKEIPKWLSASKMLSNLTLELWSAVMIPAWLDFHATTPRSTAHLLHVDLHARNNQKPVKHPIASFMSSTGIGATPAPALPHSSSCGRRTKPVSVEPAAMLPFSSNGGTSKRKAAKWRTHDVDSLGWRNVSMAMLPRITTV
mmetsp:Transcript_53504/g.135114  ORF Transcript_53504/g.135114 Transcript_53504/m.135114 type:complete len:201 (+) Transcript_53504:370-972(+)